jgi:hypothetical protein
VKISSVLSFSCHPELVSGSEGFGISSNPSLRASEASVGVSSFWFSSLNRFLYETGDLTKIKKVFKYRKEKKIAVCAMRAMMHVSNPGRHRGYAEPSGVTGVAFFILMLEVGKK